ncbi:PP2C family serine/threonine-protein phosphatase [Amycolatopsis sp. FDAARGOS 1241]|uniref:PP2C family protein-serine/threonine phosphatase n=1 Tax=Amycolatopsis sp. FDAARGOS 1241 TaxID=2778070 RepID=UPI00194F658C|nr:protein phosphatase 2C domain-containing protein [Amycolatopsis sp. FDAARGOS 1241]QRP46458.1 serine/threonine-protein phosphatase [Amycolatopsis sp. FDAARGOS 1241]
MVTNQTRFTLRYAAGSDTGRRRSINEDSVYASGRLLAVADGIGGQPHGEVASATAVGVLASLDSELRSLDLASLDLQATLADGVRRIGERLAEVAEQDPATHGMGTTLTTLLFDGVRFAAAHIGDSRGYLLRAGELHRITRDHTLVQALVEDGRISQADAVDHPRRSLLMKALQSTGSGEPDVWEFTPAAGDRILLCSDGLTAGAAEPAIAEVLATGTPEETVPALITLANDGGGPDNITIVVADVLPT